MMQLAILPGPGSPTDLDSFLLPVIDEFTHLGQHGMAVKLDGIEVCRSKAYMVMATGDIPAVASMCHHSGHTSTHGCRICTIVTERLDSRQCFKIHNSRIRVADNFINPRIYNNVSFI